MIPTTHKHYYGDETRWFVGRVVQVHGDPEELGRVRCRIYGVHPDNPNDARLEDLPWASVVIPSTEGGTSGFGGSVGIKENAQVFGIFLDGKNSQLPLILGSIPKNENLKTRRYNEKSVGNSNVDHGVHPPEVDTDFSEGDGQGRVVMKNQNAIRCQPLQPRLMQILKKAAQEAKVDVEVFSGGQFKAGYGPRVGKKRHDEGYAADVWIYSGGQRLSTARPHPVVSKFIASCVSNGARGIGAGPGYMDGVGIHVDLWGDKIPSGSNTWGKNNRSANTPDWVLAAYNSGKNSIGKLDPKPVEKQLVSNKIKEKSQATSEFKEDANKSIQQRATMEGTKANDVGKTTDTGFTTVSTTTGYDEVKDLPVAAVMTNDIPTQDIQKKGSDTSTISDLTGGSNTNGVLDEVVVQANPKGMDVALREVVGVPGENVANIVKKASSIESVINDAVTVEQSGGVEKDLGSKVVAASRKISAELGNPFGFLNKLGGINSGVSNIIPNLLSQAFGGSGVSSILTETNLIKKGTKILDELNNRVEPPPLVKNNGVSNLTNLLTTSEVPNQRITYQVGLDDGNWQGANTRGTAVGGTYDFKSMQTYDHLEAEMKYASDQREITSLIIDWSNLPYGYDDYTVDKIHDFAVRKHTAKYGATAINNNPTGFGLQTHFYVHQSGTVKKVVPAKNTLISLKYPNERNKIFEKCIYVMINTSLDNPPTAKLWESLNEILKAFMNVFPGGEILGLRDLAPYDVTSGPNFDVRTYVARKYGKSSIFTERTITEIPNASELADRSPEQIISNQRSTTTKTNINDTVKGTQTKSINLDQIAKDWKNNNLKVLDEQRQKAEEMRKVIASDGSGIGNEAVARLDESIDKTLTENLLNKSEALKQGLRYNNDTRTFKA